MAISRQDVIEKYSDSLDQLYKAIGKIKRTDSGNDGAAVIAFLDYMAEKVVQHEYEHQVITIYRPVWKGARCVKADSVSTAQVMISSRCTGSILQVNEEESLLAEFIVSNDFLSGLALSDFWKAVCESISSTWNADEVNNQIRQIRDRMRESEFDTDPDVSHDFSFKKQGGERS